MSSVQLQYASSQSKTALDIHRQTLHPAESSGPRKGERHTQTINQRRASVPSLQLGPLPTEHIDTFHRGKRDECHFAAVESGGREEWFESVDNVVVSILIPVYLYSQHIGLYVALIHPYTGLQVRWGGASDAVSNSQLMFALPRPCALVQSNPFTSPTHIPIRP